jgi:hypothetical protein
VTEAMGLMQGNSETRGDSETRSDSEARSLQAEPPIVDGSQRLQPSAANPAFAVNPAVGQSSKPIPAVGSRSGKLGSPDQFDTMYGASRAFDLFTLMAITLAFALLFAALNVLAPAFEGSPATLTWLISGYVTLIALAQMFMFEGKNPRRASVFAGPFVMLMILIVGWTFGSRMPLGQALFFSIWSSVAFGFFAGYLSVAVVAGVFLVGFFAGYLSGAVVAGVFLVADAMRGRYNNPDLGVQSARDLSFDEIE